MRIIDLGLIEYSEACDLQRETTQDVREGAEECLFLLEHPPVITFGRNGGEEHLPRPRAYFEKQGISLARSSRGGSITCHFPGQLVAYPVMRVDRRKGGLKEFFAGMEESVIRALGRFGLEARRIEGRPGVWAGGKKICSIGIAVKHWVSSHGLSLNVARDLSLFSLVTPCGLPGVHATSVQRELGCGDVDVSLVKPVLAEEFCNVFHVRGTVRRLERAPVCPQPTPLPEESGKRHDKTDTHTRG